MAVIMRSCARVSMYVWLQKWCQRAPLIAANRATAYAIDRAPNRSRATQ